MNPSEIAHALEEQIDRLDELVDEVTDAGRNAAETESAFKIEHAKARLTIKATAIEKLTVSDIEAEALVACEELHLQYLLGENNLITTREVIRLSQTKCDALRTLSASFRAQA
jgi:hypothetical protein